MTKQKIDPVLDSSEIAATKQISYFNKVRLDMNGDPRLDGLVEAVKKEITANNWKLPQNEKEICFKIVELEHDKKFYGTYDPNIEKATPEMDKLRQQGVDRLSQSQPLDQLGTTASDTKLAADTQKMSSSYAARGNQLKNYATNTLVCREEAAVASYVMDKVGIHNDYCTTPGFNAIGHAFVQSRVTGNIIDATDAKEPYRVNLSKTSIRNGEVVIAKAKDMPIQTYGNGSTNIKGNLQHAMTNAVDIASNPDIQHNPLTELEATKDIETIKSYLHHSKDDYKRSVASAMSNYEKKVEGLPKPHFDRDKPITVEQAQENAARFYADMDKGKHILGIIPAGGKLDGTITHQEYLDSVSHGHPIKVKQDTAQTKKPETTISVRHLVASEDNEIRWLDKNHNGIILPSEVQARVQEIVKDLNKQNEKEHLKPMSPTAVKNFTQHLQDMVYGKN